MVGLTGLTQNARPVNENLSPGQNVLQGFVRGLKSLTSGRTYNDFNSIFVFSLYGLFGMANMVRRF